MQEILDHFPWRSLGDYFGATPPLFPDGASLKALSLVLGNYAVFIDGDLFPFEPPKDVE